MYFSVDRHSTLYVSSLPQPHSRSLTSFVDMHLGKVWKSPLERWERQATLGLLVRYRAPTCRTAIRAGGGIFRRFARGGTRRLKPAHH